MRFLAYTVADPCMDEKDIGFCPRCGRELVRGTTLYPRVPAEYPSVGGVLHSKAKGCTSVSSAVSVFLRTSRRRCAEAHAVPHHEDRRKRPFHAACRDLPRRSDRSGLCPSAVECQTCCLDEESVRGIVGEFKTQLPQVEAMVAESLLSEDAKKEYLRIFCDRLAMFRLM